MGDGDRQERMQRIRTGLTGLAVVLLIIILASVVFTRVNQATGTTNSATVSNGEDEPLSDIGVVPGASENGTAANSTH